MSKRPRPADDAASAPPLPVTSLSRDAASDSATANKRKRRRKRGGAAAAGGLEAQVPHSAEQARPASVRRVKPADGDASAGVAGPGAGSDGAPPRGDMRRSADTSHHVPAKAPSSTLQRSTPAPAPAAGGSAVAARPAPAKALPRVSDLQAKFRSKLGGAQFRRLNELLYTTSGKEAFRHFSSNKRDFEMYHEGFREQVHKWPINPLDVFIRRVLKHPDAVVGDFGCGEARLSASVPNRVHSFDLVAANDRVVACDIRRTPLPPACLDIAVFCLSLMGTDYASFLTEAHRTLKPEGSLLIAEVRSRFAIEGSSDAAAAEKAGIASFSDGVCAIGFRLVGKNTSNKMFVLFEFRKRGRPAADAAPHVPALKPCLYKRR